MRATAILASLFIGICSKAESIIFENNVKSLQTMVNSNWQEEPLMLLGSDDVLSVDFDELSHNIHRYAYRLEHCEADWTVSEEIFESDWLEGFNDNVIEDYEKSINTTVPYTHYQIHIPNDKCSLLLSGNYRLHVFDTENGKEILHTDFMVIEPLATIGLEITTNTDVDVNRSHQQINMQLSYGTLHITNPEEQLQTVVMQNGDRRTVRRNVAANYKTDKGMEWKHNKELIFDAGNEYRKFEILDVKHPTMGIDHIDYDGQRYHVVPFTDEERRNYTIDKDANGRFVVRNSDNIEINTVSDYTLVHFQLHTAERNAITPFVDGLWATDADRSTYDMRYNHETGCYEADVLMKQGYYNYHYMARTTNGVANMDTEGSFFETENEYCAFAYYKGNTDRTWRLVACSIIKSDMR